MLAAAKEIFRPLIEATRDLAPIVIVIAFFQVAVLKQPFPHLPQMLEGVLLVLVGLALFVRGLEIGMFPLGEGMAHDFAKKGNLFWLLAFAFLLGFGTTVAEPALTAIAAKAAQVAAVAGMIAPTNDAIAAYALGLRLTVALSVGCAILLGVMRIILGWSLPGCIITGYILVVIVTQFAPHEIVGIAYDAGGVTTSTITVPLVTALGVGLATSLRERNPMLDGFGLIAFASLLPILFVMIYGMAL